jgi:hypothetical protein
VGRIGHHGVAQDLTDRASWASKFGKDGASLNFIGRSRRILSAQSSTRSGSPGRSPASARRMRRQLPGTADWPVVPPDRVQRSHTGLITQGSQRHQDRRVMEIRGAASSCRGFLILSGQALGPDVIQPGAELGNERVDHLVAPLPSAVPVQAVPS